MWRLQLDPATVCVAEASLHAPNNIHCLEWSALIILCVYVYTYTTCVCVHACMLCNTSKECEPIKKDLKLWLVKYVYHLKLINRDT